MSDEIEDIKIGGTSPSEYIRGRLDAIEECARICENGEWVGYANQHSPTKSCALAIRDLAPDNKADAMSDECPHVPAAFINAIAEEGTKAEAVAFLQKVWNENCAIRSELQKLRAKVAKRYLRGPTQ